MIAVAEFELHSQLTFYISSTSYISYISYNLYIYKGSIYNIIVTTVYHLQENEEENPYKLPLEVSVHLRYLYQVKGMRDTEILKVYPKLSKFQQEICI